MENSSTATKYPLTFQNESHVTDQQLVKFVKTVNADAKDVCNGIVKALQNENVSATATGDSDGNWTIEVNNSAHGEATPTAINVNATITIVGNMADIVPITTAINAFFANWWAVGGLIATGAAVVGGVILLRVYPRP